MFAPGVLSSHKSSWIMLSHHSILDLADASRLVVTAAMKVVCLSLVANNSEHSSTHGSLHSL